MTVQNDEADALRTSRPRNANVMTRDNSDSLPPHAEASKRTATTTSQSRASSPCCRRAASSKPNTSDTQPQGYSTRERYFSCSQSSNSARSGTNKSCSDHTALSRSSAGQGRTASSSSMRLGICTLTWFDCFRYEAGQTECRCNHCVTCSSAFVREPFAPITGRNRWRNSCNTALWIRSSAQAEKTAPSLKQIAVSSYLLAVSSYPDLHLHPLQIPGEGRGLRLSGLLHGKKKQLSLERIRAREETRARVTRLSDRAQGLRPLGSQMLECHR